MFDMESPIPFRAVLVSKGSDVVAIGATVSDGSAEHFDLGATAELKAGFAGRGSDFVAEDTEDLCWRY